VKIPKATKLPSGNWNINMMVDRQRISITAATRKEVERQAAARRREDREEAEGTGGPDAHQGHR